MAGQPNDDKTVRRRTEPRPDAAEMEKLPGGIGRYRVVRVLGQGGFGRVYLAHDDQLDRPVAVKVPHRRLVPRPEDAEAYLAEARTAASLDHPHIVPVYDVGSTGEHPCFFVSKFIEGRTLAGKIKDDRPTPGEAAGLVATIAEALHHAHRQGLVHRDIKPGNILLDAAGKPFVADFGLALKEENVGYGPRYPGTPAYMSPEQARGEGHRVDGRSDIFSLGVVFYQLLTGRQPFHSDSREELLEQITSMEVRPPRQWDDAIPKELERICLKALSKRASERYTTAKDMADDLRHFSAEASCEEKSRVVGRGAAEAATATPIPRPPTRPGSDSQPVKIVPKGLRSFDEADADFFLELLPGPRDRDGVPDSIRFWKTRIEKMDADSSFSVGLIYGPSGCGKSSLVKAGLLPRLAKPVRVVYIEATGEETEARLLKGLRRQLPDLPGNLSLSESLAGLRRGRYLEAGQKVLLVLDQFEQWLHAKRNEENTDLVQALLQCDGGRAQAIVLVRDDFWLAVSRFMQALESRVVEGENSRLVDLFDPRHATKVLTAFGRAFEALSEKELTKEQDAFLDQAVAGLAQDGKVISVRLALFAEMVKGKPWTPATLREVGGTEGVGVTFLDETFTASTAPPRHRLHQKAAPAVLKALLPESGTDIKGHMRSQQELLEASGYASRPKDFDDLLRILDRELRLITPTDPEGKEDADTSTLPAGAKYYQLTHDYLVPSLRDWLTRKQKETRRGRAELLLADRAALWNARPENRQLPSLLQWLQVRWLTAKKHWTLPQRRMMRKAGRYHAKRGLLLTLLVLVATSCGLGAYLYTNQANHAAGLVRLLETADIAQVPGIVEELEPYRYWANARLKEANHKAAPGSRQKLNTSIALLPVQADEAEYLYDRLLDAELEFGQLQDPKPNVVRVILDSAAKHPAQGEHRERILLRLGAEVGASPQPNAKEDVKEKVAKRQAKAAVALLRMGQPEKVWRLLKHSADPRVRSYLIHLLGPSGVDFKVIRQQLKPQSSEVTIRRALLLSLGEFREEDIAADERDALVNDLRAWYTDDADPGIHGAIEWLLRKWKHGQWLKETNEQWASRKRRREERLESIRRGLANPGTGDLVPQWYVNSQGQTMVVIPSSVEFSVGSPLTEDGRWDDERPQQRQRIGHHFAITAKSVTVDQFRNFLKNHNPRSSHEPDCPVSMLSWYKAAEYCNWLSDQEGLERCYEPNEEGKYDVGMKPLPDCLDRTGYRLPTEEEWECACRAGAVTSRYYGESVELLRKYGRYVENSSNRSGNVATLKPNDWGLFDMHGNVWNWCQDRYEPSKTEKRIFRGGSYVDAADDVRAARRLKTNPDTPTRYVGLRPARTLR